MAKLLLIGNNPATTEVVEHQLAGEGHEVTKAPDSASAWDKAVQTSPDLALVDLTLSEDEGWSFIQKARNDGRFARLPMIVVTGSYQETSEKRARELGCEPLSKPFVSRTLTDLVERMLGQAPSAPSPSVGAATNLVPVGVTLLLDRYQIDGVVYLAPELSRFSDAWEALLGDRRSFIPLTDVRVVTTDGSGYESHSEFMEISKSDVRAASPSRKGPPPAP